ncbi:MAG TPA: tetratricopeptide repeat protein [Actinomycetes bacterium]|nr:tetratricopeptide repeat protein [Actinomycetes bacterium]
MTVPTGPSFNPYGAVDLGALAQARQAKEQAEAARARAASADGTGNTATATVVEVTEASFQAEVLERSLQVPVVIDFWAEWCGPCKQLSPILEKFAVEDAGSWVLAKIDVDANQQLSAAAQVQSIPTVLVVWQGQIIPGFQGALPETQVRDFLNQVIALPSQVPAQQGAGPAGTDEAADATADPELAAADDALTRGDLEGAEAAYRQILATNPEHAEAKRALGSLTLLKRTAGLNADEVLARASGSDDVAVNSQAADLELLNGQVSDAFNRMIELVRRTSGDDRDMAKDHLLELLDLVGNDVPEVLAARRELASALF